MPTRPIEAFLESRHLDLASHVASFENGSLAALPMAEQDRAARSQARSLVAHLSRARLMDPLLRPEGPDLRALCLIREALAGVSPLADALFALQCLGTMPLLLAGGTEHQDWVEQVAAGKAIAGFAMTEPEAGSDVAALRTRAFRDGDGFRLDGSKWLISNAGLADFYVVFASTEPELGSRGISAFLVAANTPGLSFPGPQVMSAPHPLGELRFQDCRVGPQALLGDWNGGFKLGMRCLDLLRPTVGAAACGMAGRALQEALQHCRQRHQFGQALAEFQLVEASLGSMATELKAARLMVFQAAWERDRGTERTTCEAAMAKSYATETAQKVVDGSLQLLGGRGMLVGNPVEHLYRAVRALRIYEGATGILQLVVARYLLAEEASRS